MTKQINNSETNEITNIEDLISCGTSAISIMTGTTVAEKISTQQNNFIDELKAKHLENLHDLTLELSRNGFCVPLSKKLILGVLGESHQFEYEMLKGVGEKLTSTLLTYELLRRDAATTKKDIREVEQMCFEYIKAILKKELTLDKEYYKLTAGTVCSLASKAYTYAYKDRGNIKNGFKPKRVAPMTMINLLLKEVFVTSSLEEAQKLCSDIYAQKTLKSDKQKE